MEKLRTFWREILIGALLVANLTAWTFVYKDKPSGLLHVYFLDIGQGDSILIDSPTHGHVLIDGGPDRKVLTELGKILPFGDRRIDVVIESHPDSDDTGGLPEVVSQYKVGAFLEPGVGSKISSDNELHARVEAAHIPSLLARRNMVVDLGDGAELVILFPDRDVSAWSANDASVVAKLVYGSESFLLTGDSTKKAENVLLGADKNILKSDVLQASLFGSAALSLRSYAEAIAPRYAVISDGAADQFGTSVSVLADALRTAGAYVLSTEPVSGLSGHSMIEFETDGKSLILK